MLQFDVPPILQFFALVVGAMGIVVLYYQTALEFRMNIESSVALFGVFYRRYF